MRIRTFLLYAISLASMAVADMHTCNNAGSKPGTFVSGRCISYDDQAKEVNHPDLTKSCCQPPHGTSYDDGPGEFCCMTDDTENFKFQDNCCSDSGRRKGVVFAQYPYPFY
nr:uncharacterized protein CTRU02_08087 [Colletotrichum truncatum]KAF6790567.1 hypothetical protein CTRU02_08087 [Colletotrichum truncatum]